MKLLTKKKQDELLQRIVANELIFESFMEEVPVCEKNLKSYEKYVENCVELSYEIGGFKGMAKVHSAINRLLKEK